MSGFPSTLSWRPQAGDRALTTWLAASLRLPHRAGMVLSPRCPWRETRIYGLPGQARRCVQEERGRPGGRELGWYTDTGGLSCTLSRRPMGGRHGASEATARHGGAKGKATVSFVLEAALVSIRRFIPQDFLAARHRAERSPLPREGARADARGVGAGLAAASECEPPPPPAGGCFPAPPADKRASGSSSVPPAGGPPAGRGQG